MCAFGERNLLPPLPSFQLRDDCTEAGAWPYLSGARDFQPLTVWQEWTHLQALPQARGSRGTAGETRDGGGVDRGLKPLPAPCQTQLSTLVSVTGSRDHAGGGGAGGQTTRNAVA